jgi:hypothetical protein
MATSSEESREHEHEEHGEESGNAEERGYCYAEANCRGGPVGPTLMTKGECAALGGKSWKTTGHDCENL